MADRDGHPHYADCRDPDCPRFPCRVYAEGLEAGYQAGRQVGQAEGYAEGYAAGAAAAARSG